MQSFALVGTSPAGATTAPGAFWPPLSPAKSLAVLAQCFRLQDAVEMIELDRVFEESPGQLDAYRTGIHQARQQ
jgi:hypothetical protein